MDVENFSLRWNDFEENLSSGLKNLRDSNQFFDVTLLSDSGQVGAHKLILSACSSFFRQILVSNPHQHPLIYLKGVSKQEITNLLNFMYCGEVDVAQEELAGFLAAAEDLKVKGLTDIGEVGKHCTKKQNNVSPTKPNLSEAKTSESYEKNEDIPAVKVESELIIVSEGLPTEHTFKPLPTAADFDADIRDFPYDEYQCGERGFEENFSNHDASSKAMDDEGSADCIFPCNTCGRTFNSISNCNRHSVTAHGNPVPVSCDICGKNFKNQESCNTHLRKFHDVYSKQNRRRDPMNQGPSWLKQFY